LTAGKGSGESGEGAGAGADPAAGFSSQEARHEQLYICITSVQRQRSDSDSQVREKLLTKVDFRFSKPLYIPHTFRNYAIISIFLFLFFIPDISIPPTPWKTPSKRVKSENIQLVLVEFAVAKSIVVHSELVGFRGLREPPLPFRRSWVAL